MEVTNTPHMGWNSITIVEDTLQMEVTYTQFSPHLK
jgi:imidazoleglycerol phosphate synthase glutamine amidotransferase subunit HisH